MKLYLIIISINIIIFLKKLILLFRKDGFKKADLLNFLFIKVSWQKCVTDFLENIKQHNCFQHKDKNKKK